MTTFIIDCPFCNAKVAAQKEGVAEENFFDSEFMTEPESLRLYVGKCPQCAHALAGVSKQLAFEQINAFEDEWSSIERVYPQGGRTLTSASIPKAASFSLGEGERCLQAGAPTAAAVMYGRALEAICHDKLKAADGSVSKQLTLAKGLAQLKAKGFIDDRLFSWSEDLRAFRNMGAHASEEVIEREDAQDLKAFAYAITEYIYDLADRYDEFKARIASKKAKANKK